jgi:hypothetical protein
MSGFFRIPVSIAIIMVLSLSFAWGFGWWWALPLQQMQEVYLIYAAATAAAIVLCLVGQLMRISSLAYYVIIGGAVFLALDFFIWQRLGLMPSVKFSRGGFPPAAIMGLFACTIYGIIAAPQKKHSPVQP